MDITGLGDTTIRIGGEYPAILDISATSYSVMATFYAFNLPTGLKRAELRRKDECYGLFVFLYPDDELPEWWDDSEVVWSLPQSGKEGGAECQCRNPSYPLGNCLKCGLPPRSEPILTDEIELALEKLP